MPVSYTCQQCGEPFKAKPSEGPRKFCGHECYRAYEAVHGRPSPVESIEFACKNCGKPFFRQPGELRQYRKTFGRDPLYCSIPCSAVGRRADTDADASSKSNCVVCGKEITRVRKPGGTINRQRKLCSSECRKKHKLAEFERLRPLESREISRTSGRHGYIRLIVPRTADTPGYAILEHRYVMQQMIGRELRPEETVHHKNGDRTCNDRSNLELFSSRHGPGQRVIDKVAFAIEMMTLYPDFVTEAGYKLVKFDGG